ncbi:hypothetical protein HU200_041747 [Digitaria exilis]|uniref:Uncharacterized protein n=1 Tax=Digitaria exilis TaxID=1010633 RepID=A0A835B6D0_9POAL|nr:hypothetical protein HU200_041747 [Digitaria exilis]
MFNLDPTHDDPVLAIRDAHRGWPCSCRPFAFAEDGCMRPLGDVCVPPPVLRLRQPEAPQPHPGHARRGRPIRRRHCTPFVVLLQETNVHVFLLLNGGNVPSGLSLSVVCVGPRLGGNKLLEYELQVGGPGAGRTGSLALSASGPVACAVCTRIWRGTTQRRVPVGARHVLELLRRRLHQSVTVNARMLTIDRRNLMPSH